MPSVRTLRPAPLAWLCVVVLCGLAPLTAAAQNPSEPPDPETKVPARGPAGVGNADGSSSQGVSQPQNALWLRADEGVTDNNGVTTWADRSGNGNDATPPVGRPSLLSSFGGFGGAAAINFDPGNNELFEVAENSDLDNTDEVTVFSVFSADRIDQNASRGILGKRFDFDDNNARDDDQYAYSQFLWRGDELYLDIPDNGNRISAGGFSANTAYTFQGWYDAASESRMYVNGADVASTGAAGPIGDEPSKLRIGILKNGQEITDGTNADRFFDGKIGEVIVYRTALNQAQRTIVNSYLANKYSLPTSNPEVQDYAYGGSYSNDFAGLGQGGDGTTHSFTNSSVLGLGVGSEFGASGFGGSDRFVFVGHDGNGPDDFTTAAFDRPVGGRTDDAARIDRTWRADLVNVGGTKAVTVTVNSDSLPAKPDASDRYFLVVDQGSGFDTAPEAYRLTDGNDDGTVTATVELEDGDHVAIAAGQRRVNFTATSGSGFENTTASPNASVTAKLNLPYTASTNPNVTGQGTDVDVAFTNTGDVAGPSGIQDDGVTNQAGSNDNGDFEADDGSGNDTAGSFDGDYEIASGTTTPVTIPAGNRTSTIDLNLDNDGLGEQTEKFEVVLDGSSITNAGVGADDRFVFSINDDDLDRDLTVVDADDNTSRQEDNTSVPETFTVELDQDGNGETAASSSPYTSVEFVVDEANTDAIPGTDLTDASVDFKIVDETGSAGDAFQERLSPTRGRLNFASGASSAELKLEINQDGVDDRDAEDIAIELANPTSAVLSQNPGNTDLVFTINDDDAPPTAQFAQSASSGGESTNGSIEVTLSRAASRAVVVDFAFDSGNSSATEGPGTDFTTAPAEDTVRFAPGETSRFITVDVNDDSESELDEAVKLDLQDDGSGDPNASPTTGATLGGTTTHTYTINDNDDPVIGTTGPGGVGKTDGSGRLALWLRADALSLNDGDKVSTWPDSSGRENEATASGSARPTYRDGRRNGRPTVEFDGSDTRMMGSVTRGFEATYFGVGNANNDNRPAMAEVHKAGNPTRNALFLRDGGKFNYFNSGSGNTGGSLSSNRYFLFGVTHDATSTIRGYDGGNEVITNTSADPNQSVDSYVIGDDRTGGDHLDGNIGEFIVFGTTLNDTRRILVENYLSAKYDIPLKTGGGAKDVYSGDSNGDYDRGMFGVGSESSDDFHTAAETDGLRFKVTSGLDAGDYLTAGYRSAGNAVNDADIGGSVTNLKARSDRTWYVDRSADTGDDLRVDVTVDLTDAGLSESPSADKSGYVLIQQDTSSANSWSAVQNGADDASGGEITFGDILLPNDKEITIGTTDRINSPLAGAQIILRGEEGNENSVDDISLDPESDAGFAFIGPPETGGTYAGLASDTDPQLIEFGLPRPMIYTYDSAADDFVEVPPAQKGTAMESGRALLLYVFDDEGSPDADPVDPTLPITVSDGDGPPTSDQTVDFSPGAQQWLFVANPYAVPFELSAIETSGGDIKSTAQIYAQGTGAKGGTYNPLSTGPDAGVVGVGQGFFLECNTQGNCPETVTLKRSGRVGGDRDVLGYTKTAAEALPERFASLSLQLTVESGGDTVSVDHAAEVLFYEEASRGWGRYDATKLAPLTRSYATVAPLSPAGDSTRRTAQVGLPWPRTPGPVEVPLDLTRTGVSGTATLRLARARQADGWTVELVDTKGTPDPADDEVRTLRPEGKGYEFSLGEAKGTTRSARSSKKQPADSLRARAGWRPEGLTLAERTAAEGRKTRGPETTARSKAPTGATSRLTLRIRPSASALPVELSRFDVKARGQSAVLRWRTASEANNAGFYVQHQSLAPGDSTAEAGDWSRLGFVEGGGTTRQPQAYQFETEEMGVGDHVFRLVQVDTDGTTTRSAPERLSLRLQSDYRVEAPYPNPTRETATLPVTVRHTQDVSVRIYDVLGREVKTVRAKALEAQQRKSIRLPTRRLASGTYFVRVRGETFTATRRLNVVR